MIALTLMVLGALLLLVAAIGLVRLSDPFQRMHAATKAGTLGTLLMLSGAWVAVDNASGVTVLLTILFLLLTLPVGAQLLGRAAYLSGATLKGLVRDDPLAGTLDRRQAEKGGEE